MLRTGLLIVLLLSIFSLDLMAQPKVDEQLAAEFFQQGDFAKAADYYLKVYRQSPAPTVYNRYLDCLLAMEDYKTAQQFLKSEASKSPHDYRFKVDQVYIMERAGEKEKAQKEYQKIKKSTLQNRQQAIDLSNAFILRQHSQEALEVLIQSKNKFNNPPLNIEIAQLYFQTGNYSNMASEYLDLAVNNADYIPMVQSRMQLLVTDSRQTSATEAIKTELLIRTQKHPNETLYAEFLYWLSMQQKEFDIALIQAKSLDQRFGEGGSRVYNLGAVLLSNEEYSLAVEAFEYVIGKGSNNPFFAASEEQLLQARFMKITSQKNYVHADLEMLEKQYLDKLSLRGRNASTVEMMLNLATLQAFYLDKIEAAKDELVLVEQIPNASPAIKAKAKLQLADMMLFSGQKWSASLLYKQVEKDFKQDVIGFEAKFRVARFYYFVGEMEWAKSQLKVLSGASSKLIANDALNLYLLIAENMSEDSTYDALSIYAKADLLVYQMKFTEATLTLDTLLSIFPNEPVLDNAIFLKAQISLRQELWNQADSLFKMAYDRDPFGLLADQSLINRARINQFQLKKTSLAKELYQQLLLNHSGSIYTLEARRAFRELDAAPMP